MAVHELERIGSFERELSRQRSEQRHAERVEIASHVDGMADPAGVLRRDVRQITRFRSLAEPQAIAGNRVGQVDEAYGPVAVHDHVSWANVAMNETSLVEG